MLGDVAAHQPLPLGVGEHLRDGGHPLVDRHRRPLTPGAALGRRGAAGEQINDQSVYLCFSEPLQRQVAVAFPQRAKVIAQFRQRRRPQLVAAGDVIGAHLIDGDGLAWDELFTGGLIGNLRQRPACFPLTAVPAPDLLTLPGRRVYARIDRKLVSHNRFPGLAIQYVDLADLGRQLLATHRGFSVISNVG
jgi:hypothetical protein